MDWTSVLLGVLASALVGLTLWALLPRGVVLTREARTQDFLGNPVYDKWQIRNASPLSVQLTSVRVLGAHTWNEATEKFEEIQLPLEGAPGVELSFDDEIASITQSEQQRQWSQTTILPGDTLQVHLSNNTTLKIDYRRAGWTGVFERRHLEIHGNV